MRCESMKTKSRIIVVDDHRVVRDGIEALLSAKEGFEVVAQASNGREAVALVQRHKPDVVIMDIAMPVLDGRDATRQILKELPETRVIGLTVLDDQMSVRGMLDAGATGYVLKENAAEQLTDAIQNVLANRTYMDRRLVS